MSSQFVDAHYLLALVNIRDQDHDAAVEHSQGRLGRLVTTTWVLVEFADALSAIRTRQLAARFLRDFQEESFVEVVAPSKEQFDAALKFYEARPDKSWSLTDCISFQIMHLLSIHEALTNDHHFEQAGFRALLRGG